MTKNKIVVLSGGLDSTTLLYDVVNEFGKDNVKALSFYYGQKHDIELVMAKKSCDSLGVEQTVIDISFMGKLVGGVSALIKDTDIDMPTIQDVMGDPAPSTEVPYRNMMLLSISLSAAQAMGADSVYYGAQATDQYSYWDTTLDFVDAINTVSHLNRKHNITIKAPYAELSKQDEIKLGVKLGLDYGDTWTCYRGANKHNEACGLCPSCSERIVAFAKSGFEDPIKYSAVIDWKQLIEKHGDV